MSYLSCADKESLRRLLRPHFPRVGTHWEKDAIVEADIISLGNTFELVICGDRSVGVSFSYHIARGTTIPGRFTGRGWKERLVQALIKHFEV